MLVYSTNLVFSFLNDIYVWGARGRPPSREPVLVPLPRGNITASPAGAAEGTADPRSDAPETDPWVPEPLRPPGPLPRIPSGRGGTDASSPRGIGGQDWHRVWRARGARERLERSIIGRAKNVTLGKGGRRAAGKHVSLNPLPVCSPGSPRHGVRLQQHTRPRADDTHTRARTLTRPAASCTLQTSA